MTSAHLGRAPTYKKVAACFFWCRIYNDVPDYIHKSGRCQRQNSLPPNVKNEIRSVPVSLHVNKQVGLDLCSFPEVNSYHHLIVCNDYFTKWSAANLIREKTALPVATFPYGLICRHGCLEDQINDQGREFNNEKSPLISYTFWQTNRRYVVDRGRVG